MLHQVAFRDGGRLALGGAPAVVRRDGRALPGRQPGPLPADRVRHRRVGPGLHDHLAGPGLRLPGRDHLPGRGGARLPRRAPDHTERDLHPRGGQRGPVEARRRAGRRRGQARPAAGGLLPRHRGQLRVPGVLAVLPGREHRVRGPRDRDPGHLAHRRGRQPAQNGTLVDERTYAPFHQHFIVARLDLDVDGPGNTVYASESQAASANDPDRPVRLWAWWSGTPRCAPRPRGSRTTTGARSAAGR